MRVDSPSETGAEHTAAGEPGDCGRERLAVGGKLGEVAPPEGVLILRAYRKFSTTQALPWLSNMSLPPAFKPPPVILSGRTQALGAKLRYGTKGVGLSGALPCGIG